MTRQMRLTVTCILIATDGAEGADPAHDDAALLVKGFGADLLITRR